MSAPDTAVAAATTEAAAPVLVRQHGEATTIVYTSFLINGLQLNVTMREGATAETTLALLREMYKVGDALKLAHATPVLNMDARNTAPASNGNGHAAPAPVAVPAAPAAPVVQQPTVPQPVTGQQSGNGNGNGYATNSGTARLLGVTMTMSNAGKIVVEYTCEGMKYPLKDSRGADKVAACWQNTGYTAAHFSALGGYDFRGESWKVDWVQKQDSKYRDVIRVYRG